MFALTIFSRGTSSRWIYPFSLPLLPLIAFGLISFCSAISSRLKVYPSPIRITLLTGLTIAVILYPAAQTLTLAVNPHKANIPFVDREQYISCANWSIRDIVAELKIQANTKKVFIGSRSPLGAGQEIGQIVELYTLPNKNIMVKGFDMSLPSYPANFFKYSKAIPSYFIIYKQWRNLIIGTDKLELIKEARNPYDPRCSTILVYKVI